MDGGTTLFFTGCLPVRPTLATDVLRYIRHRRGVRNHWEGKKAQLWLGGDGSASAAGQLRVAFPCHFLWQVSTTRPSAAAQVALSQVRR